MRYFLLLFSFAFLMLQYHSSIAQEATPSAQDAMSDENAGSVERAANEAGTGDSAAKSALLDGFTTADLTPEQKDKLKEAIQKLKAEQNALKRELESLASDVTEMKVIKDASSEKIDDISSQIADVESRDDLSNEQAENIDSMITALEDMKKEQEDNLQKLDDIEVKVKAITEKQMSTDDQISKILKDKP